MVIRPIGSVASILTQHGPINLGVAIFVVVIDARWIIIFIPGYLVAIDFHFKIDVASIADAQIPIGDGMAIVTAVSRS